MIGMESFTPDSDRCMSKQNCIQICENMEYCGAILWKLNNDCHCPGGEQKCLVAKMISQNVIDDSMFIRGINMILYLKDGVKGMAHLLYFHFFKKF